MLLIAIAVLTLLSIIAVTFAALMRLERKATENFRNAAGAEMLVDSGTSAVIAMLRGGALWDGHTDLSNRQSPWLYGSRTSRGDLRYGGLEPLDRLQNPENSSLTLELGASYAGAESKDRFRTKVIDCNSQIYLNGEQDTLAQMLDNLGQAIRNNPELKYNPLYSGPRMTGKQITGREILRFRSRRLNRRPPRPAPNSNRSTRTRWRLAIRRIGADPNPLPRALRRQRRRPTRTPAHRRSSRSRMQHRSGSP